MNVESSKTNPPNPKCTHNEECGESKQIIKISPPNLPLRNPFLHNLSPASGAIPPRGYSKTNPPNAQKFKESKQINLPQSQSLPT